LARFDESVGKRRRNSKARRRLDPHVRSSRIDFQEHIAAVGRYDEIKRAIDEAKGLHECGDFRRNFTRQRYRLVRDVVLSVAPIELGLGERLGIDLDGKDTGADDLMRNSYDLSMRS
jgi:hypothetical protein